MAERQDKSESGSIPSNDKVIDEIVESCSKANIGEDENEPLDEELEKEIHDDDFIDESTLKDAEVSCTAKELEERKQHAFEFKENGNAFFKTKEYDSARNEYTKALRLCPLAYKEDRAILFANRGACKMKQDLKKEAIADCTSALELNATYLKALQRRATLYESDENLDEALADFKRILELDPANNEARGACMRLPSQINERNEKLKAQMLGSLKELGNKFLSPFGLSTENFQLQQDPNSGGYSINFQQNRK